MSSKLEEVARSIWSSSAVLGDDPNQPAMMPGGGMWVWHWRDMGAPVEG